MKEGGNIMREIFVMRIFFSTLILSQNLDTLVIQNGRIEIGFLNIGKIGVVNFNGSYFGMRYDGIHTMWSGGLYMSGKTMVKFGQMEHILKQLI